MKVILDHSDEEASNIRTFWLKPEKPISYTAGQYIELTIKHDNPDDRGEKRWFTLSSAPGHDMVTITTKYAGDDKSSSFKKALFHLETGTELDISEPMGDFVLPKDETIPLVFVAGGIGLTPFHSMCEWLSENQLQRKIHMLHSVRTEGEIIFQDTFERAGVHQTIIVSEPSGAWGGERGRLDAEMILGLAKPPENALIYLSGPEPMVVAFEKDLQVHGIKKYRLVGDFFPGYTSI